MDGRYVHLREAEVLATAPPPPIWIAGKGPRMLRLTARHATGWNLAWRGLDPSWLAEPLTSLREELEAAGRDRSGFTVSAGVAWVPTGDNGPELAEALAAYEAAGVDLVILTLSNGPVGPTRPEWLDLAAEALALARR
jgi:phthiodiolone/phenolphthiodiolone dimycocerosates ketoreductase